MNRIAEAARTVKLISPQLAGASTKKLSDRFAKMRASGSINPAAATRSESVKTGVKAGKDVGKRGLEKRSKNVELRGKLAREIGAAQKRGGAGTPAAGGKPGKKIKQMLKERQQDKPQLKKKGAKADKKGKLGKKGKKGPKQDKPAAGAGVTPDSLDYELDRYRHEAGRGAHPDNVRLDAELAAYHASRKAEEAAAAAST